MFTFDLDQIVRYKNCNTEISLRDLIVLSEPKKDTFTVS